MKLQRLLGAICAALFLFSTARADEQASYVTPAAGPMPMSTFVTAHLNPALRAIASCHNGSSAPVNGPSGAPLAYQCWIDTTTNPSGYKIYDGASWVALGTINTGTHAWTPQLASIPSGQVLANNTAGTAAPAAATATSWFDRAYCNTVGYLLVRFTGAWTCSNAFPLDITWVGADPTGVADSAPAIRTAIAASTNVSAPAGSFKLATCVNNAIIDYSPAGIQNHTAILRGVAGAAALSGDGTRFILDASIPNTCSVIRRAGTNQAEGTTLSNLTIHPSTGYYGAGVGLNCIFIDATGQPDYFEYKMTIDNVFCGNMSAGDSVVTFASPDAPITASISTTTMTVTAVSSNAIFAGSNIVNASGVVVAKVVSQLTGTTGQTGTYTITPSQTLGSSSLTALGNNGGGAWNNAIVRDSVLMSIRMKRTGDNILFVNDTVGQGELRGAPGYIWDQVSGAASVKVIGGLIGSVNGMIIVDGGTFPYIGVGLELEQANVANSQGCLIDFRGATSKISGGLIQGITISQNSSVGTVYPICVKNADSVQVFNNRLSTTSATPTHLLNTVASANTGFNFNQCWTNGVAVDCVAGNASGSINSTKVNIGTANGTDLLSVGGFATISGLHMPNSNNTFTFLPPPSGVGQFRFPVGTSLDMVSTGGAGQVLRQSTSGGAMDVGTVSMSVNGTTCTTGSSCTPNTPTTQLTGTLQAAQEPAHTGDCTNTAGSLSLACLKTNGVSFAASATTDATNASNISSGTLADARMPNTARGTFTPSPSCGTAVFTTNSARFRTWGKETLLSMDISLTTLGTCTGGAFSFTLPATAAAPAGGGGAEQTGLGVPIGCLITAAAATTGSCLAQVALAAGQRYRVSMTYENQ